MKKQKFPIIELLTLAFGELIVAALVVGGYAVADLILKDAVFSYRVFTGLCLGTLVTMGNYLFMILSVNKQINKFLELRGTAAMDEEQAAKFAKENSTPIQAAIAFSFIIRTVTMLITLVVALLLDFFAPIATVVPLLAFRPIITGTELIRAKLAKPLSPSPAVSFKDITDSPANLEEMTKEISEKESDE